VVVEQEARRVDPATGSEQGRAVVASQFLVRHGVVVRYARHDELPTVLVAAGLDQADEVVARLGS
jgi:hypothetical protein